MTGLPLLYRAVVPLDRATQYTFHLANPQRFGFARDSHRVPAAIDAFGAARRHRPILFLPDSLGPTPVFLSGLVPAHCAPIDADGAWTGRDRPAYLRRFPFILGGTGDAPPLVCLDGTSDSIRHDSADAAPAEAAALFREDGRETPLPEERVRPTADDADAAFPHHGLRPHASGSRPAAGTDGAGPGCRDRCQPRDARGARHRRGRARRPDG